jgi:hypothetical protein
VTAEATVARKAPLRLPRAARVSFEAINLTGENVRWHGRSERQVWLLEDQGARYALGVRYELSVRVAVYRCCALPIICLRLHDPWPCPP